MVFKLQGVIMPTLYVFYKDNTVIFDAFDSSIRTTLYRKIDDISNNIKINNDIKAVFFVTEMLSYKYSAEVFQKSYEERRSTLNPQNSLGLYMIDDILSFRLFHFITDNLDYAQAVKDIENHNFYTTTITESHFLYPILYAFETHRQ